MMYLHSFAPTKVASKPGVPHWVDWELEHQGSVGFHTAIKGDLLAG